MTCCQNCGRQSHCEGPLWVDSDAIQDGEAYQYRACDHCRCANCMPDNQDPKKDIPTSFLNGL